MYSRYPAQIPGADPTSDQLGDTDNQKRHAWLQRGSVSMPNTSASRLHSLDLTYCNQANDREEPGGGNAVLGEMHDTNKDDINNREGYTGNV